MADSKEHCVCIEFYFKPGTIATATYNMMKTAFGEDAINRLKIWLVSNPKNGVTSVNNVKEARFHLQEMPTHYPCVSVVEDRIHHKNYVVTAIGTS